MIASPKTPFDAYIFEIDIVGWAVTQVIMDTQNEKEIWLNKYNSFGVGMFVWELMYDFIHRATNSFSPRNIIINK